MGKTTTTKLSLSGQLLPLLLNGQLWWMDQLWYVHTWTYGMVWYVHTMATLLLSNKKDELLTHTMTWMPLKNILRAKKPDTKSSHCLNTFMWSSRLAEQISSDRNHMSSCLGQGVGGGLTAKGTRELNVIGGRNVLYPAWDSSYRDVHICQDSPNCVLTMCTFYCL